jgi:hypothetical protein
VDVAAVEQRGDRGAELVGGRAVEFAAYGDDYLVAAGWFDCDAQLRLPVRDCDVHSSVILVTWMAIAGYPIGGDMAEI